MNNIIPVEVIAEKIFEIRNQKVMIDADLAKLYGVPTKRLNESVKRNTKRFPEDLMFQLSVQEKDELVANCDRFTNTKHSAPLSGVSELTDRSIFFGRDRKAFFYCRF